MDKPDAKKAKNRKTSARAKSPKKKSTDGPACSMFLVELSRKLAQKKREEQDAPKNIVASILESLTNAIPTIIRKASPPRAVSPVKIETLQTLAPELQLNDVIDISLTGTEQDSERIDVQQERKRRFKMPKMPVITSDVFKQQRHVPTEDVAVNTSSSHDLASHLAKYVDTLKKISLIAEEFNQKTAKNLKEIVDSVQEDLQVKLQELKAEQKLMKVDLPLQVAQEDIDQAGTSQ